MIASVLHIHDTCSDSFEETASLRYIEVEQMLALLDESVAVATVNEPVAVVGMREIALYSRKALRKFCRR